MLTADVLTCRMEVTASLSQAHTIRDHDHTVGRQSRWRATRLMSTPLGPIRLTPTDQGGQGKAKPAAS